MDALSRQFCIILDPGGNMGKPGKVPDQPSRLFLVNRLNGVCLCAVVFVLLFSIVLSRGWMPMSKRQPVTVRVRATLYTPRGTLGTHSGDGSDVAAGKKSAIPSVTIAALSCRRVDLLEKTLATFELHNTYPITARLVLDCDNASAALKMAQSVHKVRHMNLPAWHTAALESYF